MAYAVKHDYPEIMGAAAPLLLDKPLEEILVKLPPNLVIPWVRLSIDIFQHEDSQLRLKDEIPWEMG